MNILVNHTNSKWQEINQVLIKNKSIGTDLVLQCQIHKDQRTKVNCGDDFSTKSPEGGCLLLCNSIMPCGHHCERICHVQDRDHIKIKCLKPCLRIICAQKHQCQELCYKNCGKCSCFMYPIEYRGSRQRNNSNVTNALFPATTGLPQRARMQGNVALGFLLATKNYYYLEEDDE